MRHGMDVDSMFLLVLIKNLQEKQFLQVSI